MQDLPPSEVLWTLRFSVGAAVYASVETHSNVDPHPGLVAAAARTLVGTTSRVPTGTRVVRVLGGFPEVSTIHTTNGRWGPMPCSGASGS